MNQDTLQTLQLRQIGEFIDSDTPSVEWVVDRVFPVNGAAILSGHAGSGKTWMLLDLALEVARGGMWLDRFESEQGTVLLIDEESSQALLHKRLSRLVTHKQMPTVDLPLVISVQRGSASRGVSELSWIRERVEVVRPSLVIVDSLVRIHRRDENSATEMAQLFREVSDMIADFSTSFVFADHNRKPGMNQAYGQHSLRGSTEKVAFVDTLLTVTKRGDCITVSQPKSRHALAVSDFQVSITDMGEEAISVSAVDTSDGKPADRVNEACGFVLDSLDEKWVDRQELLSLGKERSIEAKPLDQAMRRLVAQGTIEQSEKKRDSGRGRAAHVYRKIPTPSHEGGPS